MQSVTILWIATEQCCTVIILVLLYKAAILTILCKASQ